MLPEGPSAPVRPLEIVVADDVPELLRLLQAWLIGRGHSVTCANSGNEVIRLMKHRDFDVIVADVLMPDGDGLDVIIEVKKARKAGPRVLAISGGGKYMTADNCLRIAKGIGADDVLLKPFTGEQFIAAVEQLGSLRPAVRRRESGGGI